MGSGGARDVFPLEGCGLKAVSHVHWHTFGSVPGVKTSFFIIFPIIKVIFLRKNLLVLKIVVLLWTIVA